jgi:hypothetical protein
VGVGGGGGAGGGGVLPPPPPPWGGGGGQQVAGQGSERGGENLSRPGLAANSVILGMIENFMLISKKQTYLGDKMPPDKVQKKKRKK